MERLVFLLVLLAAFANGQISFTASLNRGNINMTCSGRDLSSSDTNVVSIVISKSADEVTYLASKSSYRTKNNFTDASVSYYYYGYSTNSVLTLMLYQLNSSVDGIYVCTVYYLTEDNIPLLASEQVTVNIEDLDPLIATTPKHIQDGLTKSLVVECSSVNLGLHDLSLPAQVELFHSYDGTEQRIASAVTYDSDTFESTAENGWDVVSGNIARGQALNLVVIRELPTTRESGTYKCILNGTNDKSGTTVQAVKTVQVTASAATKQEIYDRVGEEDQKDYYVFTCNFENGLCGFDPSPQSFDHAWEHVQSRLFSDIPDHTLGTGLGHYLRVLLSQRNYETTTIKSKEFPPMRRRFCISFWYYLNGSYSELTVNIRVNSTSSQPRNTFTSSATYGWNYKEVAVPTVSQPFTVELQVLNYYSYYYSQGTTNLALIDDFALSDINCNGS